MRRTLKGAVLCLALIAGLVTSPGTALAEPVEDAVGTFTWQGVRPLGFSARENTLDPFTANSDLAFWGTLAFQGNYDGFRIIDIQDPRNPVEVADYRECVGNQGDVVVWGSILVRSWNSSAPDGATCDGEPVLPGVFGPWEGLHVFDVSNPADPDLVASVETECGSHTATGVPDLANGRLLIYNSPSSGTCPGIDIVEVPLDAPAEASYLRFEPSDRSCHDTGVILGEALMAACAGGNGFTVWSLDPAEGGSLEDPAQLYSMVVPTVTSGHSASFTWDGRVLIFGHEPGGGGSPRCTATGTQITPTIVQTDEMKTMFFYEAATGAELGRFVLPRNQTLTENCTIHNYNVVPSRKRYVVVAGNYQSGVSVVDFTNPSSPKELAFADPAPLSETELILGGDWSTYWYNGRIYESDITRGLIVWEPTAMPRNIGALPLEHLNPQTQEFSL